MPRRLEFNSPVIGVIDGAERVTDEESFAVARRLIREEGLLVGGSSGTTVAAALRVAARGGYDGPIVAVLADSWDRYFDTREPRLDQRAVEGTEEKI